MTENYPTFGTPVELEVLLPSLLRKCAGLVTFCARNRSVSYGNRGTERFASTSDFTAIVGDAGTRRLAHQVLRF